MFLKGQNAAQLAAFLSWRAPCDWDPHLERQWSIMGTKINTPSTSDCIISQSPASQVLSLRCMILIWLSCSSATVMMKIHSKSYLQPFKRFGFANSLSGIPKMFHAKWQFGIYYAAAQWFHLSFCLSCTIQHYLCKNQTNLYTNKSTLIAVSHTEFNHRNPLMLWGMEHLSLQPFGKCQAKP